MRRSRWGSLAVALGLALGAVPLAAQSIKVGGQASFGDDSDFGLGPRAQVTLPWIAPGLWLAGSFDYFFPDSGLTDLRGDYDYRELNVNVLGDISIASVTNFTPYVGGGVNVTWQTVPSEGEEGTPERLFGLNLVGGLRFPLVGFNPFVEARYELQGGEQLVIAGGILLP
ncbi:hypothetical protein [Candidatus Palauibacter sp.]|uniref:hypothetical protein n=1 Tax=Candidatus Palauibacter sp. TaxID=3101350 RepID=UPI003AF1E6F3